MGLRTVLGNEIVVLVFGSLLWKEHRLLAVRTLVTVFLVFFLGDTHLPYATPYLRTYVEVLLFLLGSAAGLHESCVGSGMVLVDVVLFLFTDHDRLPVVDRTTFARVGLDGGAYVFPCEQLLVRFVESVQNESGVVGLLLRPFVVVLVILFLDLVIFINLLFQFLSELL